MRPELVSYIAHLSREADLTEPAISDATIDRALRRHSEPFAAPEFALAFGLEEGCYATALGRVKGWTHADVPTEWGPEPRTGVTERLDAILGSQATIVDGEEDGPITRRLSSPEACAALEWALAGGRG